PRAPSRICSPDSRRRPTRDAAADSSPRRLAASTPAISSGILDFSPVVSNRSPSPPPSSPWLAPPARPPSASSSPASTPRTASPTPSSTCTLTLPS
uniref:Uncharacterized protein n=1 Tax=Aegilops tauschii subsp. strangulata TaxID=200361 RepID=A0A453EL84_AEGTS